MVDELQPIVQRIVLKDDAAESAKSEAAINRVRGELRGLAQDTVQAAMPASTAALQYDNLAQAVGALGLSSNQVAQLTGETTNLASATDKAIVSEERLAQAVAKTAQASASGGGLDKARQVAGVAGGVASTVGGGQAVSAVSSILGLTAALGPLGAVAGTGVVAIKAVTDAEVARAEAAKNTADAINEIYGGAVGQTTEAINQQLASLSSQRASLEQGRDFLKSLQGEADQNFGFVNITGTSVRLSDVLTENATAIEDVNKQIVIHTAQLNTEAVAQADAAVSAQLFADQLAEATEKTTQSQLGAAQRAVEIQRMTTEQRDEEVRSISEEITVLQNYIDTHALTEDAYNDLSDQLDVLQTRTEELTGTTITYADVLEQEARQKERLTTHTDNYFDALAREGEIRGRIAEITQQLATNQAEYTAESLKLIETYNAQIAEIEASAGERRAEISGDAQDRIQDIEASAAIDRSKAIARLDAEALRRANQQEVEQKKRADKSEDKQLDSLERALEKQLRTNESGYRDRQYALSAANQKEFTALQSKYQQEQVALTNTIFAEQQIALSGAGNQRIIHTQLWQDLNNIAVTWMANTVNTVRSIAQNSGFFSGSSVSGSQVQQIATQAARDYMYDQLRNGRWITAY